MATSIIRNSDIVQVLRATFSTDEYGSLVPNWASPTVVATGRGSVQHYLSLEEDIDRQTETEGARLFTEDTVFVGTLQAEDRLLYNGRTWEITSPPQEWRMFGRYHHTEIFLKLVQG